MSTVYKHYMLSRCAATPSRNATYGVTDPLHQMGYKASLIYLRDSLYCFPTYQMDTLGFFP